MLTKLSIYTRFAAAFNMIALLGLTQVAAEDTVVRFQTNAGRFDVLLNPTNNQNLQPLVDSFLDYVNSGRYDNTVMNRSADLISGDDFVTQWGGFVADVATVDQLGTGGFSTVEEFDSVILDADNDGEIDFDTSGLGNTIGTVAFALRFGGPNTSSSSVFVNLSDNLFLEEQGYVPFAVVQDLAAFIDTIADLPTFDLSSQIGSPGNLAYTDVPILGQNRFVVVRRAFVIPEPGTLSLFLSVGSILVMRRKR
ncbi:MAG: peptidylprolyl isomerase [Lacipirellulaceae bacterium]